jgi:formylglycine-generating enzyme required for sulfatase activity
VRIRTIAALLLILAGAARAAPDDRDFRECADCPLMVGIPAGPFDMGSAASEAGRFDSEGPQHRVTVKPFALGKYPVSGAEFLRFLSASGYQPAPCNVLLGLQWRSPGHGLAYAPTETQSPQWPATCLNWNDAQAYLAWLNARLRSQGVRGHYRLPSEAEWEYAARAGNSAARWWGEQVGSGNANCAGCGSAWDGREIAPVGSFAANGFGLYDMLGNVWQWVEDCWNDSYVGAPVDGSAWLSGDCSRRVLRGGSWSSLPVFVRSAARSRARADGQDFDYSSYATFRVARSLP